jgi:hypothetical protein
MQRMFTDNLIRTDLLHPFRSVFYGVLQPGLLQFRIRSCLLTIAMLAVS